MSVWGHAVHVTTRVTSRECRVVPVPGSDALAHRDSPCAGPRSLPSSAWSRVAFPYCSLREKGTKLVTLGAAMIKKKTMWIKPRLRAIQPCLLRRAAPSRSLAPAGAPKAAGAAAIEI